MDRPTSSGYPTTPTQCSDYTSYDSTPTPQIIVPTSLKVWCPVHGLEVFEFCMSHTSVMCPQCLHQISAECVCKSVHKDIIEVHSAVHVKVGELTEAIPCQQLTQEVRTTIEKRFSKGINENLGLLTLLEDLNDKANGLICCFCGQHADCALDQSTLEGYCTKCLSQRYTDQKLVNITGFDKDKVCQTLRDWLRFLLLNVNFSDLTLDILEILIEKSDTDVKTLQHVAKQLSLLGASTIKGSFQALPDYFYCPECRRLIRKATCSMLVLPCSKKLHAICNLCAKAKVADSSVTCPLDRYIYAFGIENLVWLQSPSPLAHAKTRPEISPASQIQYPAPTRFIPVVPEFTQTIPELPNNIARNQGFEYANSSFGLASSQSLIRADPASPSREVRKQMSVSIPAVRPEPGSNLDNIPGILLPALNLPSQSYHLTRFPSVLPSSFPISAKLKQQNKGWFIDFSKNQVEAVTLSCFEGCIITGLGIATPIKRGTLAIVDSVKMYQGAETASEPIFVHSKYEPLVSGTEVIAYVNFDQPFPMPPFTKISLEVKIAQLEGNSELIWLYRGNPYDRPDVCCGSDGLIWEFQAVEKVGEGKFVNGENNFTGPILRILYRRR